MPFGDDAAVVDDPDPVGEHVGLLEVLGREEDRHAEVAVEPLDLLPHRRAAHRVEAGRRLVEEQHLGVVDQRGGEVEAALHAARVAGDAPVEGVTEIDQLAELLGAAIGIAGRQAVQPTLQPQQLAPGLAGIERRLLEGDADAQPDLAGVLDDVEAGDGRLAARRRQQRAQHPHGRRLAGAVRAEEAVDLAAPDLEVDAGDGVLVVEVADQGAGADGGVVIVGGHGGGLLCPIRRTATRRVIAPGRGVQSIVPV